MNGVARALVLSFVFIAILSSLSFGAYAFTVDFVANNTVPFNGNISVRGNIVNSTPENLTGPNWVINVSLANNNFAQTTTFNPTTQNASFNVSVNASSISGPSWLLLKVSNGTMTISRSLKPRVSNVSTAVIEFVGRVPPFAPGNFITAKVTAKNWSGGALNNQDINASVFQADGAGASWGSNTSKTNANGETLLNFSIPSNAAAGNYIMTVEDGAGFIFFGVASYSLEVATKDATGSNKNAFAPGSVVTIESRLTYTNGTPISGAATTIEVKDPNGLITSSTGSSYSDGRFQYNYTASATGSYSIKAVSGGERQSGSFAARTLSASIVNRETASFFREFAGKKLFPPGQNVSLTILPTNVSSGEILASGASTYDCSQSNFTVLDVYFANNQTSINSTMGKWLSFVPTIHTGTSVCGIEFNLTSNYAGLFGIKVNVTTGDSATTVAQGYFSIQRYGLSVEPSSEFGEGGFQAMLLPGVNASFKLIAFDITGGANLNGYNITEAFVKKITILSFGGQGSTEITGLENNFTFYSASLSDGEPYVLGGPVPAYAGPQMISVMATVNGTPNITADAFFMGKYLMGFGMPSGTRFEGGEGEGGGGHEGGRGGGMSMDCSGTTEFNVMVFDAKTMMPASSVSFLSVLTAKEEATGSDIASCLTVTRGLTSSSGQARINVTFSSACSYTGFYFMLFNVSFQDKTDQIPSGFSCESMSMTPNMYNSLNQQRFSFSPTSNITIIVSNVSYTVNSSRVIAGGNMSITQLVNFNPSAGANVLDAISPINVSIVLSNGNYQGNITINPMHFRSAGKPLSKWPTGFFETRIKICDNATQATRGYNGTCGTSSNAGFKIAAFDMWTDWWMGSASQSVYQPGALINGTRLFADLPPDNFPINISRIVIELLDFKSGKKYNSTAVTWVNGTPAFWMGAPGVPPSSIENVSFNFTLPSTLKSGDYGAIVTATNNLGSTTETNEEFMFLQVKGMTVGAPMEEDWSAGSGHCAPAAFYDQQWNGNTHQLMGTADGWSAMNWSFINSTYLGINYTTGMYSDLGFSTMVCTGATLDLTNNRNQRTTNLTSLNVMSVSNNTHFFVFLGNRTNTSQIIRLQPTQNIPYTGYNRLYLWSADGAPFIRFVNVTTLSSSVGGGPMGGGATTVSTEFTFAGSHRIREMIRIPMVAFTGNDGQGSQATRLANYAFNITNVAEMNTEGFGIKSTLPQSVYDYNITGGNWTDFEGNRTNADGLVFIPLNITKNGRFMAFWKVNSTPAEKSSFKNSINFNVRAFNTQSNFVQLLPNTTKRIILRANATQNVTFMAAVGNNASSGFLEATAPTIFYNGSFTETAADQFVRDGLLETFYFVVTNATPQNGASYYRGNLTTLYIDDDAQFTDTGQCSASMGARSQQTNELSVGCGAGSSGASRNYPTMSISSTDSGKGLNFGSTPALGLTDWWFNSTHAILNFYESSPSIDWAIAGSSTQRFGMRVCSSTFSNTAKNATFALKYNNWMQGRLSVSQTANLTVYNITHDAAINLPNETSASIYDGCLLTEVLPQSGSWSAGRSEVVGTVTELNNTGGSTGVQEELFAGPIEFLSGGSKTFG